MTLKANAVQAEQHEAYMAAVRYLGIREHNEHELREKLKTKQYDELVIDHVIELLKQYDYLSEARYAESFLRSRLKKGETPWLAAQKARQKGAEPMALKAAVIDAEQSFDIWAACREVLDKRDPMGLHKQDKRVWQRQMRYLQNKGYDTHTILQVMNNEDD